MPVNRFRSVNDIVNQVAVECGLTPVPDVFTTTDEAFQQLRMLLTTCVQELMEMYDWQILTREFNYVTGPGEQGALDLPEDFGYMINQTGWERSENVPLIGPLSAQDWTYLLGRDLVGSTIYASFRYDQNKLYIFPNDPMPEGLDINFEYISRNLILESGSDPATYADTANAPADIVLFPPNMITRMLKMKFKDAKGFDTTKDTNDFWLSFNSWKGKDNSAPLLSAGGSRQYPYISWYNVPDTGYGRAP